MMMKTSGDKFYVLAGIIAQLGVGFCVWQASANFNWHWHGLLRGAVLPPFTIMALAALRWVPLVAGCLIAGGVLLPVTRRRLVWWTLLVALMEVLILAFLMLCISLPGVRMTYPL
jgi:hypothetical protein